MCFQKVGWFVASCMATKSGHSFFLMVCVKLIKMEKEKKNRKEEIKRKEKQEEEQKQTHANVFFFFPTWTCWKHQLDYLVNQILSLLPTYLQNRYHKW